MILQKYHVRLKGTSISGIGIGSATVYLLGIPLSEPFVISLGTQNDYNGVVVELNSASNTGYGEGSTIAQITGEVPWALYESMKHLVIGLNGKAIEDMEGLSHYLDASMYGNPVAKNAVDIATHDLICKEYGISISALLGGSMKKLPTSYTIPIGDVESNLRELENFQKIKVRIIKVKVGTDVKADIQRVRAISSRLQGEKFYVDANQGYDLRDAVMLGKVLSDEGALFFEQPLGRHDWNAHKELRERIDVPITLDESISSPGDVIEAILHGAADMINVKLTKSGGIRGASKTLITAQAYGIKAMVGCMIESKLGIAASHAVASSFDNVAYTDLDGFQSISRQPFGGGVEFVDGFNIPVNGNGMAVRKLAKNW